MKREINPITFLAAILAVILCAGHCAAQDMDPAEAAPKTISLDIKGMEIIDVLKMLSLEGAMNIVAGSNVRGRVTVFLKDVDIMDALDIICISNNLAYEKKSGIIHVMTDRDYEMKYGEQYEDKKLVRIIQLKHAKAGDVSKALTQLKSRIGKVIVDEASNTIVVMDSAVVISQMEQLAHTVDMPMMTKVFVLNYSKAETMKAKLEPLLTQPIGNIHIDERTNKIIVRDLTVNMGLIERAVEEFDEKTKEVLIESKILQITLNDEYKAGINWDAVFHGINTQVGLNFDVDSNIKVPTSASSTGAAVSISGLDSHKFGTIVKFLQQYGRTDLLSSPRIVALNNEEAKIMVGTNQPYATSQTTVGSAGAPVKSYQITFLDLGVKLFVTPTINEDGFITMKIRPEVSSVTDTLRYGDDSDEVPVVKTSQAETTVMVKDGTSIVIAGLIETRSEKSINKVPILGDIPFLGGLFRGTTTGSTTNPEKQELVVFLTPHLIDGEADSKEIREYSSLLDKLEHKYLEKELKERMETSEVLERANMEYTRDTKEFTAKVKPDAPAQPAASEKEMPAAEKPGMNPAAEQAGRSNGQRNEDPAGGPDATDDNTVAMDEYYARVREKIFANIQRFYPDTDNAGDVYISFVILRDGRLKGTPEILKPANDDLKQAAIKSVKHSAPFEPFPKGFAKSQETFRVVVSYERQR